MQREWIALQWNKWVATYWSNEFTIIMAFPNLTILCGESLWDCYSGKGFFLEDSAFVMTKWVQRSSSCFDVDRSTQQF